MAKKCLLILLLIAPIALFLLIWQSRADDLIQPLSERELRLQDAIEWKSFIESYNVWRDSIEKLTNGSDADRNQFEAHTHECIDKAVKLESLVKRRLISNIEYKIITEYCTKKFYENMLQNGIEDKRNWGTVKEKYEFLESKTLEKLYRTSKFQLPYMVELAEQKDCIEWIKKEYLVLISLKVAGLKNANPRSMKFWDMPVEMTEMRKVRDELDRVFNALKIPRPMCTIDEDFNEQFNESINKW